jgi:hypothetical protein
MKETDGRDDRIRKLFSRLPRVKAPQGFEERVARAVAGGRPGRSGFPARLRAFAIPGMAALLVGVISYLVYHDRTDTDPELSIPTADTVAVQPGPVGTDIPSQDEHVSPMPAPLEPETTQPSAPGRMSRPKSRFAPPQVMMGEPTADTAAAAANPVEQGFAHHTRLPRHAGFPRPAGFTRAPRFRGCRFTAGPARFVARKARHPETGVNRAFRLDILGALSYIKHPAAL